MPRAVGNGLIRETAQGLSAVDALKGFCQLATPPLSSIRQVWEGGLGWRAMYLATVDSATL